jgi:hypothetical protein
MSRDHSQLLDWSEHDSMIEEIFHFTRQQLDQGLLTTVSPCVALRFSYPAASCNCNLFEPLACCFICLLIRSRYFTLLAPYPPEMIVGIAMSHAAHAADKVQQVQLPAAWNARPVLAWPLHIAFVSSDFRGHVTAHLLQVMHICKCNCHLHLSFYPSLSTLLLPIFQ